MGKSTNLYVAVVDDDESLYRSMARLLRAAGILAVTYPSAESFLAASKRPGSMVCHWTPHWAVFPALS